jgi:hypothetical protein
MVSRTLRVMYEEVYRGQILAESLNDLPEYKDIILTSPVVLRMAIRIGLRELEKKLKTREET